MKKKESNRRMVSTLFFIYRHRPTWDKFPGLARLIDKNNLVLAANQAAEAVGLTAGQICAKMGGTGQGEGSHLFIFHIAHP